MKIEDDVIVSHGRWCLARIIYEQHVAPIEKIMDDRREHLRRHPEDFVQSLS